MENLKFYFLEINKTFIIPVNFFCVSLLIAIDKMKALKIMPLFGKFTL